MKKDTYTDKILDKMNGRAFSIIAALIMILGDIYMCFKDLTANGKIDLKATGEFREFRGQCI